MNKFLLNLCLWLLLGSTALAQTRAITGKVTDKKGETLIGVTVSVKGGSQAAATDVNGNFKLNIPSGNNVVLVVKYIGFKQQEVAVGNKTKVDVELQESDATMLNEVAVVNIGYGTVSKAAITGSVSSVSAKDVKDFPVSTAAEALAGKLAGVTVTTTEGKPGADILIRVRGGGSLTGDNSPLYIVDGVQVDNALSLISPQEIQSIDVLKDVASAAIYGSRGANGVVIITTKSGREGRTTVNFSAYSGVRKIVNELPVLNPYDFVMYQYDIQNYNTTQDQKNSFIKTYGTFDDLDIYKNVGFSDWQDEVFGRNALSRTGNLNITGGTKTSSFSLTLNNTKEDGIMLKSGFQRSFATFRFDNKISDHFKFGLNVRYSRQRIEGAGTTTTGSQGNNYLRNSVRYRPFEGGTTADPDIFDVDYANLTNLTSPTLLANNLIQYNYKNDIITSGNVTYTIIKGLELRSLVGFTNTDLRGNSFAGTITPLARQNVNMPVVNTTTGNRTAFINSNTLSYNYSKKFHNLSVLVGEEINQSRVKTFNAQTKFLPVDITPEEAFAGIQKATPPAGYVQETPTTSDNGGVKLLSFFGRAQYSYKDKYLGTLSYRADGSSLFAPNNRWGYFPSGQVAWRLTEESFVKKANLKWLDNAKLRLSYGGGGNNNIDADQYKILFAAGSQYGYAVGEAVTPGFASPVLANAYIKWETTYSANIGLDIGLFKGRLNATIDFYQNKVKNLLLRADLPYTTGFPYQQQNIGQTSNKGIEIQLNGVVANTKNFQYNASLNFAFNRNKVVSLGPGVNSILIGSGWVNSLNDFQVAVGQPVGQFYGYVNDGRYEVDDFNAVLNTNTNTYTYTLKPGIANSSAAILGNRQPQPGDQKLKKLSGGTDMNIGENDRTVLGNAQPKFTGGFNNQFSFRNFDLSVFANFSYGGKTYNANKIEYTTQYQYVDNNMLTVVANRWRSFDDNGVRVTEPNALKALNANTSFWRPSGGNYTLTSFAIEDASFLRITNITLGYSLPQAWLKRTKAVSRVRVYATVNNLHTFTNYSGFDPEANTRRVDPRTPNVDYAAYPRSRYILAGIDVSF